MRPLFLAPTLTPAEKFLVAAWTCCQLRHTCGSSTALPYTSIEKLLEHDSAKLLQLWPASASAAGAGIQQHQGAAMIKLLFSKLLILHHNSPPPPQQQQQQQLGGSTTNGTGSSSSSGGDVLGKAGAAGATVGKPRNSGDSVEAAVGSLQAMNINGQQQQQQQPRGQGGPQACSWADEADEEHGPYGDASGEYGNGHEHEDYGEYDEDHEEGDEAAGGEGGQAAGGRGYGPPGARSGGANASDAAVGAEGRAGEPNARTRLPLRPDLMKSYLWAVFGADGGGGGGSGPGGAKDVLAALAAAALVPAGLGRGRQPPSYDSPAATALRERMRAEAKERRQATQGGVPLWNFDPLCFSMPLSRLAAHLQAAAQKALSPAVGGGGAVGAVLQALRDPRHGRGCFRVVTLPAEEGDGGGTVEEVLGAEEEEVAVLDMGVLRERVVDALQVGRRRVGVGERWTWACVLRMLASAVWHR